MGLRTILALLGIVPILVAPVTSWLPAGTDRSGALSASMSFPSRPAFPCPVSRPTDDIPPSLPKPSEPVYFGHDALWTQLWPRGRVIFEPGGPGFMLPDGSLGMKWPWIPFVPGDLTIEGRRLDHPAPPLQSRITGPATTGDGERFFPTYLIFPTPGCWEVTGRIGDATLTFVTQVVKVGGGPNWRPESVP